jgi:hypothetical protein
MIKMGSLSIWAIAQVAYVLPDPVGEQSMYPGILSRISKMRLQWFIW